MARLYEYPEFLQYHKKGKARKVSQNYQSLQVRHFTQLSRIFFVHKKGISAPLPAAGPHRLDIMSNPVHVT
jgi:hypothetical protein